MYEQTVIFSNSNFSHSKYKLINSNYSHGKSVMFHIKLETDIIHRTNIKLI